MLDQVPLASLSTWFHNYHRVSVNNIFRMGKLFSSFLKMFKLSQSQALCLSFSFWLHPTSFFHFDAKFLEPAVTIFLRCFPLSMWWLPLSFPSLPNGVLPAAGIPLRSCLIKTRKANKLQLLQEYLYFNRWFFKIEIYKKVKGIKV